MTSEQIKLIKQSWRVFRSVDPLVVGDLFYSKLFADNPSLRKMFPKDMNGQYVKLVDTLSAIVARLDQLEVLTDDIAAMAQRHVQYGVKPSHYKLVGNALLWTLERGLGKDYTSEVNEAWEICYKLLSDTMIKASENTTVQRF